MDDAIIIRKFDCRATFLANQSIRWVAIDGANRYRVAFTTVSAPTT